MTTSTTITVHANPDADDCLSAAAADYIEDHPELAGWDLSPRWADDTRETVALTVPVIPDEDIEIASYTGRWDEAMRPTAPALMTQVRVAKQPDAREWDAFRRVLARADRDIEFRGMTNEDGETWDEYVVVEASGEDE